MFSLFLGGTRLNSNDPGTRSIEVDGSEVVIHPDYNEANLNNDLALIRLPEALEDTGKLKLGFSMRQVIAKALVMLKVALNTPFDKQISEYFTILSFLSTTLSTACRNNKTNSYSTTW